MQRFALILIAVASTVAAQAAGSQASFGPGTGYELEVLYVNSPGHPTNVVPGLGVPFSPVSVVPDLFLSDGDVFGRPWISADGQHWLVRARADTGPDGGEDVYLLDGAVLLRQGQPAPWAPPGSGELVGPLPDRAAVNSDGDVVLVAPTVKGGSVWRHYVVRLNGDGSTSVLAREGEDVAPVLPGLAGATWGPEFSSPVLTDTGKVGWEASALSGTPSGQYDDTVLVFGGLFAQEGDVVDNPLSPGTTTKWREFIADGFHVTPDESRDLVFGMYAGWPPLSRVVAVDGTIALQQGKSIPGADPSLFVDLNGFYQCWLDSTGTWFARGTDWSYGYSWVVRDGALVAYSGLGDPVPGTAETWTNDDWSLPLVNKCFFAFDGNASGAYVIGGLTTAPHQTNDVLVVYDGLGGGRVAARQGDPIDLDGDGALDDDRFIHSFDQDEVLLHDDGSLWFSATLRNAAMTEFEQGLFRISPCVGSKYGEGASPVNSLDLTGAGSASVGHTFEAVTSNVDGALVVTVFALSPDSFPVFGGVGLVDTGSLVTLGSTPPAGGVAVLPVAIPPVPALAGLEIFVQSGADDPDQPQGMALSNGLKVTLCE